MGPEDSFRTVGQHATVIISNGLPAFFLRAAYHLLRLVRSTRRRRNQQRGCIRCADASSSLRPSKNFLTGAKRRILSSTGCRGHPCRGSVKPPWFHIKSSGFSFPIFDTRSFSDKNRSVMRQIQDIHVRTTEPLIAPYLLKNEMPVDEGIARTVVEARETIREILAGRDRRMLCIVGPCSIHDPDAAIDYAHRLA